jgi:hypothetical protein
VDLDDVDGRFLPSFLESGSCGDDGFGFHGRPDLALGAETTSTAQEGPGEAVHQAPCSCASQPRGGGLAEADTPEDRGRRVARASIRRANGVVIAAHR